MLVTVIEFPRIDLRCHRSSEAASLVEQSRKQSDRDSHANGITCLKGAGRTHGLKILRSRRSGLTTTFPNRVAGLAEQTLVKRRNQRPSTGVGRPSLVNFAHFRESLIQKILQSDNLTTVAVTEHNL